MRFPRRRRWWLGALLPLMVAAGLAGWVVYEAREAALRRAVAKGAGVDESVIGPTATAHAVGQSRRFPPAVKAWARDTFRDVTVLDLRHSATHETVAAVAARRWPTLTALYMPERPLDDAEWALPAGCPALDRLTISNAGLTDARLLALPPYPRLAQLQLFGNPAVTDAGLAVLRRLPRLDLLDVEGSAVTDAGLAELVHCPKLEYLAAGYTRIDGRGLANLAACPALRVVQLRATPLTDAGLGKLPFLPDLYRIDLENTGIDGSTLFAAGLPTKLVVLNLGHTRCGIALERLRGLPALEWLDVSDTPVSDADLAHLATLPKLERVALRNTAASPAAVAALRGRGVSVDGP